MKNRSSFCLLPLLLLMFFTACAFRSELPETRPIPDWLLDVIDQGERHDSNDYPKSIYRFDYKNEITYLIFNGIKDDFYPLYNENGTLLGYPVGGIAGGGNGSLPDFNETSTNRTFIWSKSIGSTPDWLLDKIDDAINGVEDTPTDAIYRYIYHDEAVYYFLAGCCDMFNSLFKADGTYLGSPDGGFSGKGDGTITDFGTRDHELLIWRRPTN